MVKGKGCGGRGRTKRILKGVMIMIPFSVLNINVYFSRTTDAFECHCVSLEYVKAGIGERLGECTTLREKALGRSINGKERPAVSRRSRAQDGGPVQRDAGTEGAMQAHRERKNSTWPGM